MQIAVVSDTHGDGYSIQNVINKIQDTDMMIHLGDYSRDAEEISMFYKNRIIYVSGNCDFGGVAPSEKLEVIEGKRFFITHGHRYNVKYGISNLKERAVALDADIALFGHTHKSFYTYEDGIWFVNPGSAAYPRDALKSIAIISIDDKCVNVSLQII